MNDDIEPGFSIAKEREFIELHDILYSDKPDGVGVRIDQELAKWILRNNKSIICGGNVYYFKIKSLGMGVYKLTKAPLGVPNHAGDYWREGGKAARD